MRRKLNSFATQLNFTWYQSGWSCALTELLIFFIDCSGTVRALFAHCFASTIHGSTVHDTVHGTVHSIVHLVFLLVGSIFFGLRYLSCKCYSYYLAS